MAIGNDIIALIRKYALKNAVDYGSAEYRVVVNKVLAQRSELKSQIKELLEIAKDIVDEVNNESREKREQEYAAYSMEFDALEREKAERTSKPNMSLEGAEIGNFATRFPPEPNGYMHIGHAKPAFLESEFARIYNGTLALYFDDTNPESEQQKFVDAIKADLKWLGIKFDREYYASDNIEKEYEYAEKMIRDGNAYVCTCTMEEMKKGRISGTACRHKSNSIEENFRMWKEMFSGSIDENGAVLRLNGDMKSDNTVMRDPVLFRIKKHAHYRQGNKYVVWPTYNFNTPVIDSIYGITDVIRSKEYELRDELYVTVLKMLGLRIPRIHSIARLEIEGNITSKRKLNMLIKQGIIQGYDDPRLITISALRRRGITPEAIKEFVMRFGMSKANSRVNIEMLLAENRKIIDKSAKRLFFVRNPVRLEINGIKGVHAKLRLHPNYDLGYREYDIGNVFYIDYNDASTLKEGERIRLKDLYNVEIKSLNPLIADYIGNENIDAKKVQWVGDGNYVKGKLVNIGELLSGDEINKKSLEEIEGYAESYINKIDENEVVQFERVGFYKLDSKKDMLFFSL